MTSQAECRNLCIVTWNTNGLKGKKTKVKSPQKISKVLNSLSTLQADIAFIQETHVGPKCSEIFREAEQKNWKVYFTVHSPKSKGVAILVNKDIEFDYICHDEDCSGGYIVLFCHLYGELYTLVNVYNHKADRKVLCRLKDYLLETAEGVLVVGGDFNTILDPHLDRTPPASRHSPFRDILEDFTISLNLRDTWSYLHPTEEGFTRHQNESYSRIDMFFTPEHKIKQVCSSRVQKQDISDHFPLIVILTVHVQSEKKIPNVATWLEERKYNSDRRVGKISGAEILRVIKSITDSEEQRCDELQVSTYKRFQCPLTEILKIHFNNMLKIKRLYTSFNESYRSGDRQIFNVDYLIFSQILAKRVSVFITPSFKGQIKTNLNIMLTLTFKRGEQVIRWSFLKEALEKLEPIPSAPPPDFTILDCILPKVQSSDELRCLQPGCPLTNTILNLALKYFVDEVFEFKWKCDEAGHLNDKDHKRKCKEIISMATVCYQRQVLHIHTQLNQYEEVEKKVSNFMEISALKIQNNSNTEDSSL